jgi:hypothetical protein
MNVPFYLTVSKSKKVRVTKTKTWTDYDEVTIAIELNLPDKLFQRPKLQASITIPEEAAQPEIITGDVVENVSEAIKTATNLDFNIKVIKHEKIKEN